MVQSEAAPTILTFGKNGQIGWELCRTLATLGNVTALDYPEIDFANPDSICGAIREAKPAIIINAAAYTAVDKAESEPEKAMTINGVAPGIIAEEAKRIGAVLVHYSTDYVFDGHKRSPYLETDIPNPLNIYGKTKLAGDLAIQAVDIPHFIFRTSWVYGWRGQNFLLTILRLAGEREELKVVDDQVGTPNWARLLAEMTAQVLAQGTACLPEFVGDRSGIYNMSSQGQASWFDFAKAILEADPQRHGHVLKRLTPIPTADYPTSASRPLYSLLEMSKLRKTFSLSLAEWSWPLRLWSSECAKIVSADSRGVAR
ncbi:MAG: dTDP-4-dehydrorhamnose reductase [Pseudomonadota bacterium]